MPLFRYQKAKNCSLTALSTTDFAVDWLVEAEGIRISESCLAAVKVQIKG